MSPRGPGPKCSKVSKFEKPVAVQRELYSTILQSQQTDENGDFADTMLICDGGTIRIHGFLLQSASPLVQRAFMSQGENYPHVRMVMLPDFPVKEIRQMLNLVYKGYTDMKTQKDVETLKKTLEFFEITNINFNCKEKWDKLEGSLKVQDTDSGCGTSQDSQNEQFSTPGTVRRSGRVSKPVLKKKPGAVEDNDSDSDYSEGESRSKRGRPPSTKANQPVVRLNRVSPVRSLASTTYSNNSTKVASTVSTPSSVKSVPPVPVAQNKEDSESDLSEDETWEKPNYKDPEWFAKESRRCQSCNKTYDRPPEASLCVTSHKSLRCYFCFRVYSSTDILFKHFKRRHKQAGRENTLICPFCDQAVPYKSVSCHVISIHLRSKTEDEKSNNKLPPPKSRAIANSPSRSSACSASSSNRSHAESPNPRKKLKMGKSSDDKEIKKKKKKVKKNDVFLKVKDLDITVEKVTKVGSTLVFRLQKKRPVFDSGAS